MRNTETGSNLLGPSFKSYSLKRLFIPETPTSGAPETKPVGFSAIRELIGQHRQIELMEFIGVTIVPKTAIAKAIILGAVRSPKLLDEKLSEIRDTLGPAPLYGYATSVAHIPMKMKKHRPQPIALHLDEEMVEQIRIDRETAVDMLGVNWNFGENPHLTFAFKYPNTARGLLGRISTEVMPFKMTLGRTELVPTEIYLRDRTPQERAFVEALNVK